MRLIIFNPTRLSFPAHTDSTEKMAALSSKLTLIVSESILRMDIPTEPKVYEFDDFRIDVAHLMLYQREAEIPLAPKAVETLLALIKRRV